jgi:hypothetical protein
MVLSLEQNTFIVMWMSYYRNPKWYPAEWRVGLLDKRLQGIIFRTIPFTCHLLKMDQ